MLHHHFDSFGTWRMVKVLGRKLEDTISLTKKFKYEEHTRSIVSMTFHDGLILLFTAAYDHSICVWNPYIPSLIYKIACHVNVIQV